MGWLESFLETKKQDPEHSVVIHKIEQALSGYPEKDARYIACVAVLLARVADADSHVSTGEKDRIRSILRGQMKLPEAMADSVLTITFDNTVFHSIERHLVIRRLNEIATLEQKQDLIRSLLHLACEDDISEAESTDIGQLATALLIPRTEFLALRSEFRNHLSILKN